MVEKGQQQHDEKNVRLMLTEGHLGFAQFNITDCIERRLGDLVVAGRVLTNGYIASFYRDDLPILHQLLIYNQQPTTATPPRSNQPLSEVVQGAVAPVAEDGFKYRRNVRVRTWSYDNAHRLHDRLQLGQPAAPDLSMQTMAQYFFNDPQPGPTDPFIMLALEERVKRQMRVKVLLSRCSFLPEKIVSITTTIQAPKTPIPPLG